MNVPDRWEAFVLQDDDVKMTYKADTKVPNAASIIVKKEDHTMGNLIRMQLHRDESVIFAGYLLPHPLVYDVEFKIRTKGSPASPLVAMTTAIEDLTTEFSGLETRFRREIDRIKAAE